MSYARWCDDCRWYIYHDCSSGKTLESQVLAVHCADANGRIHFSYPDVEWMIGAKDYSAIPGDTACDEKNQEILRSCLASWAEQMVEECNP